jgi:predicted TPR repeat methyltransferase
LATDFDERSRTWDLMTSTAAPEERFDLILTVMVLHHIVDLEPVLAGFAALLADGGTLCVVDLEENADGSYHRSNPDFEGHDGFERDTLTRRLGTAGFTGIRFTHCLDMDEQGIVHPLFLATATGRRRSDGQ